MGRVSRLAHELVVQYGPVPAGVHLGMARLRAREKSIRQAVPGLGLGEAGRGCRAVHRRALLLDYTTPSSPRPPPPRSAWVVIIESARVIRSMFATSSLSGVMLDATLPVDCFAAFNATVASDSPLTDALGTDDLNLLHELLNVDAAADLAGEIASSPPSSPTCSIKRERSPSTSSMEEASERSAKRARTAIDGKPPKSKSQSQRQKEEIAQLKDQVEQLNAKLTELHERKRQRETTVDEATSDESACNSPVKAAPRKSLSSQRLWQSMAKRQQAELQNVERENASLRDQVSRRWKQMKNLERSIVNAQIEQLRKTNQHCVADQLNEIINYAC